ncbi:MAG TPA: peptidylprolyl isomerase [Gemmatimonadaceae bacterium]|nr:peptidylprolyl isomerase [Gemmatimonadaceae bacterium]
MKKSVALLLALAAVSAAPRPAAAQATQAARSLVPIDRVVAVVGSDPIMESEVREVIVARAQQDSSFKPPTDSAGWADFQRTIINGLIDERLLLQEAKDEGIELPDSVLAPTVDAQIRQTRARFPTEAQFRDELAKAGLGTPADYRRFLIDQLRTSQLQQAVTAKLKRDGKILPVSVSEDEVQAAFNAMKGNLPKRPATFTWRQIVIDPQPTAKAKAAALARIDSIRAEIVAGGDFARIAKRESMDSTTREVGGDLGWNRRGGGLVPSFERWLFAVEPGQVSPVFETPFGYHILRVDRVNGPERKARHILIRPVVDSADVARTVLIADSVKQRWLAGVSFDSLAAKYHDYASREETAILTPYPFDSLPQTYQDAFAGLKNGDAVVFKIANTQNPAVPKVVVARVESYEPGGDMTIDDVRSRLRDNLEQSAAIRRYLDGLRKTVFVEIKPDALLPPPGAGAAGSAPGAGPSP